MLNFRKELSEVLRKREDKDYYVKMYLAENERKMEEQINSIFKEMITIFRKLNDHAFSDKVYVIEKVGYVAYMGMSDQLKISNSIITGEEFTQIHNLDASLLIDRLYTSLLEQGLNVYGHVEGEKFRIDISNA